MSQPHRNPSAATFHLYRGKPTMEQRAYGFPRCHSERSEDLGFSLRLTTFCAPFSPKSLILRGLIEGGHLMVLLIQSSWRQLTPRGLSLAPCALSLFPCDIY